MRPFRDLQQTPNLFIAACCRWLLPVLAVLFVSLQPLPALSAAAASSPRLSEPTGQGMSLEQLAAKNGAIAAELATDEGALGALREREVIFVAAVVRQAHDERGVGGRREGQATVRGSRPRTRR